MTGRIPPRSSDTTPEAERVQVDLLRAASVGRRIHVAFALSATVISAARRGLARARPDASSRELDLLFVAVHYGADLAERLRVDLARRDAAGTPETS